MVFIPIDGSNASIGQTHLALLSDTCPYEALPGKIGFEFAAQPQDSLGVKLRDA